MAFFRWRVALVFLLAALRLPLLAQTTAQKYRAAAQQFQSHTADDVFHDDSKGGVDALEQMWNESAQAVLEALSAKPSASASDLHAALCQLPSSTGDCGEKDGVSTSVIAIGPLLFLATQSNGEAGPVFLAGFRGDHPALLWCINNAAAQAVDPQHLLRAWRADRAGEKCREANAKNPSGTCGPLDAEIGKLPTDSAGRPRFYLDAEYAQMAGATSAHQTSVWRWDGDAATLLWIDQHNFVIDQKIGTKFSHGTLTIGEKQEFRSFYGCGSCEERQMVQRLQITPTGIVDKGITSTTPELDLIDELFWRLSSNQPTAEIATPEVSRVLRAKILAAREASKKVDPNWFSVGMLGDVSIQRKGDIEHVCFTADDIGRVYFTLQNRPAGKLRLIHATQLSENYGDCPK